MYIYMYRLSGYFYFSLKCLRTDVFVWKGNCEAFEDLMKIFQKKLLYNNICNLLQSVYNNVLMSSMKMIA